MVVIKSVWSPPKPAGGARGNSLSEISIVYCFRFLFTLFHYLLHTCVSLDHYRPYFFHEYYLFFIVFVLIASVVTWIISCGASCSADHHSHTSRKPDHHILVVFIFNLLVIYMPFILLNFIFTINPALCRSLPVWLNPIFLMSVRLISDPLLCVLVCRAESQNSNITKPEETNLV